MRKAGLCVCVGKSQPVFFAPMNLADKTTGQISPLWKQYFAQHGAAILQGVPGTNPGDKFN